MDSLISKDYFDNDVLHSLLIDAANIIYRHIVPGAPRNDVWDTARSRAIAEYLPIASAALPLSAVQITPTDEQPPSVCFVDIPLEALERIASDFLVHLLQDVSAKGLATFDREKHPELDRAIEQVALRVAKMWTRAWL